MNEVMTVNISSVQTSALTFWDSTGTGPLSKLTNVLLYSL